MTKQRIEFTIAIDGPAGAGKSTIGERVAASLNGVYFDTGVLYRAVTLLALRESVPLDNAEQLARLAERLDLRVERPSRDDGRQSDILLDGEDITWEIRSAEVDESVSQVSAHPAVREALLPTQRRIARSGRVVMVGRDIGTVVMPDADLKVFLQATAEERARRRCLQIEASGHAADFDDVLADMLRRDRIDSERVASPLRPADDAVIVDTDGKSIDTVVREVLALARSHMISPCAVEAKR